MTRIKNRDLCWEKLFEKYNILKNIEKNWIFEITANQIKEFWEPRLMTKYDHYQQLPDVFKNNYLSILPNKNWSYLIWPFSTHQNISYWNIPLRQVSPRTDLESLNPDNLFSEAVSLNYALATWMLKDLVWEVCELTVSWRMKSSDFSFVISNSVSWKDNVIEVHNAQIEIDWWYESKNKLILVEAKKWKCDDFIIRQLYYPFRLLKDKVNKEIIPVFMTESNWVFSFFIFEFEDEKNYNSIKLIKQIDYSIDYKPLTKKDIDSLDDIKFVKEPEVPFPQADDFDKCINVLELLKYGEKTREDVSDTFWYVKRQWDYYANACIYLWLVEADKNWVIRLTKVWKEIIELPRKDRNIRLIKTILSHKPFYDVYSFYSKEWKISKEESVNILKKNKLYKVNSDVTYYRRSSTVNCWCQWILDRINEKLENYKSYKD